MVKHKEAIAALKRQGSIEDSSAVWNNLGVAYIEQGDHKKAYEALIHAMRKDNTGGRDYLLAGRNICHLLAIKNEYKVLLTFSSEILGENNKDKFNTIKKDRVLSDIIAFNLHSLWRLNKKDECMTLSNKIIYDGDDVAPRLIAWIVSMLIGYFAISKDDNLVALKLSEEFKFLIDKLKEQDSDRKEQLINNIAYAYTEEGRLNEAERYLHLLSSKIHKDPYPTATLGFISFRKGNFERGERLYSEAINLAQKRIDKIRIRQKLNYELAKVWIDNDITKAKRYLERVIDHKEGSSELADRAKLLKEGLLLPPNEV